MESQIPKKLDTTLGELIAAASEVAFEYSQSDEEAYKLARLALVELLKRSSRSVTLDEEFERPSPGKQYLQ
jgi:hypothetical protein